MPFQSEKQRRYLHANHPEIAKRWERDYAHGGILDINESKEIIDDSGNEIALTDYNADFDNPNDLSTGVKSLFRAKEGGNVRLGPHKATDLLVKKTSTGERPKYQPPGHQDASVSGPPGGGATSMGSGRDYSPAPTRAPDFVTGVGSTKTTTTTPTDDGPGNIHGGPSVKEVLQKVELDKKKTKETASKQGWHQFITPRHKTPAPEEKSFLDKLAWGIAIYTGLAPLVGLKVPQVVSVTGNLLSKRGEIEQAVKVYNKMFGTDYSFKEFIDNQAEKMITSSKERKEKMDLYESLPKGHPERIALEIELEIGKKPEHLGDDGGSPDLPQVDPIGEEVQEYESIAPDAGATLASIRSKQALNAQLQAKWAAEQEAYDKLYMVANRGGLANLFRVKKQ